MSKSKKIKPNLFMEHYKSGKAFLMLSRDILKHPAYLALSDKQRLILMHLLAYLSSEASRRPESMSKEGFSYTWKMCGEDCSENTFSTAMKTFIRIGWIECKHEDQATFNWNRNIYRISKRWQSYALNAQEAEAQQQKKSYKTDRLKKKKESKVECLTVFFTPND